MPLWDSAQWEDDIGPGESGRAGILRFCEYAVVCVTNPGRGTSFAIEDERPMTGPLDTAWWVGRVLLPHSIPPTPLEMAALRTAISGSFNPGKRLFLI